MGSMEQDLQPDFEIIPVFDRGTHQQEVVRMFREQILVMTVELAEFSHVAMAHDRIACTLCRGEGHFAGEFPG